MYKKKQAFPYEAVPKDGDRKISFRLYKPDLSDN